MLEWSQDFVLRGSPLSIVAALQAGNILPTKWQGMPAVHLIRLLHSYCVHSLVLRATCLLTLAQVLQRYFTPQSAAMAEYALASAVVQRVKSHHARIGGDAARLSPVQSLSGREGGGRLSVRRPSRCGMVLIHLLEHPGMHTLQKGCS